MWWAPSVGSDVSALSEEHTSFLKNFLQASIVVNLMKAKLFRTNCSKERTVYFGTQKEHPFAI